MSDLTIEGKVDPNALYTVTLTISNKPTPVEVVKSMAEVARFLQRLSAEILREDGGRPAMVSAANPAPNAMLQSSATLERGALEFDALVKQQAGLIQGGQVNQGRQGFRTN